jgi:hypothetical protein
MPSLSQIHPSALHRSVNLLVQKITIQWLGSELLVRVVSHFGRNENQSTAVDAVALVGRGVETLAFEDVPQVAIA